MELLYDLEYKLNYLRKDYLDKVKYGNLTLKDVLDLGFNRVYIDKYYFWKDKEDNYLVGCGTYFRDENILNKKVVFEDSEYYTDNYEYFDYLEVYVSFENKEDIKLLKKYEKEL